MTDVHDLGRGLPGALVYEGLIAGDSGRWDAAHGAARKMAGHRIAAHPGAGLFFGAPAVAFALHAVGHPAYGAALATLDESVASLVSARLAAANRRMGSGQPPRMREFDLISGLTGLGAYLLHAGSRPGLLCEVLDYLVRLLTQPVRVCGEQVPGWWTSDCPAGDPDDGAGHANFGLAHGLAGPVALVALAARAGHLVPGQRQALAASCGLLEQWAQPAPGGAAWPETLPLDAWLAGPTGAFREGRPSWCYGSPGIARSLQLAAIACGQDTVRARAEEVLAECLGDPVQLARITDLTVCHGWAGLCLAADRAAADAPVSSPLRRMLPGLHSEFTTRLAADALPSTSGLLTGVDGVLLADRTLRTSRPVPTGWATCLLLT
ncbi:lanthionine synthetase C family protein [Streptomyces sp. NPDC051840]|uniref:lanthionine synthetase C family protein n=1 Tax=Streptomyces sp. NPDC051840 TaxID=3154752 RepID=UPI00341481A0